MPGAGPWGFLDGAWCISLQERPDRARSAAAEFHRTGLCRLVTFYRPRRHPRRPVIGIWEAHRAVAQAALARGQGRVLIMEDDVRFPHHLASTRLAKVSRSVEELPRDWMIYYLGHWPIWARLERPGLLRVSSGCAHAYVASRAHLEWLVAHPFGSPAARLRRGLGKGIDAAYAALPGTYAHYPMLAVQSGSPSDRLAQTRAKPMRSLYHLAVRTRLFERLFSATMRLNEHAIVTLARLRELPRPALRAIGRAARRPGPTP